MFDWFKKGASTVRSPRWVSLDLETSGLDPKRDRIVELGAVAVHDGMVDLGDYIAIEAERYKNYI